MSETPQGYTPNPDCHTLTTRVTLDGSPLERTDLIDPFYIGEGMLDQIKENRLRRLAHDADVDVDRLENIEQHVTEPS